MARKRNVYKSAKRLKEVQRQKKKQEKTLKRQGKPTPPEEEDRG